MIVSPSLLSANFYNLSADIDMINRSAAAWLHLDIMDGTFAPNISFGFPVVRALAPHCTKCLDVHYMIVDPLRYVEQTAALGVHMMTIHVEAVHDLHTTLAAIHAHGMRAGVALNPETPLTAVASVLNEADMFLVMSVHPGFSGQKFIEESVARVVALKEMLRAADSKALIEVDGGVDDSNASRLRAAGMDVVVCGDHIFHASAPEQVIASLAAL